MRCHSFKYCLFFLTLFLSTTIYPQGLPPGWDFVDTPTTHIISIKITVNPNINGYLLQPGDYIGTFYLDNGGQIKCGGAIVWTGNQNTGIIAYGDDSFTTPKDGFSSGELIHWKAYSWSVQKEYDAEVTCDTGLPSTCTNFVPSGLAGLATFDATGFFLTAGADPVGICLGDVVQLLATPSGGSGSYSYSWTSVPSGFFSNLPNPQVSPLISTQYVVTVSDGIESLMLSVSVSVTNPPSVSCGDDQTVCEDQNVAVNGIVTNGNNSAWTTTGDGSFLDPASLVTQYFPGINDILSGSVVLLLTTQPTAPCIESVSDQITVVFQYQPMVNAGTDQDICENDVVMLLPSISYSSSILWETNGDGVFDNPVIPETNYTPGSNDVLSGTVTLTITGSPLVPCELAVSDYLIVLIQLLPEAAAGNDSTICQDGFAQLSGTALNYSSIEWTTSGDGSFNNSAFLTSNYYPGTSDVALGNVLVSLNVLPISPCETTANDNLIVYIVKLPLVSAGTDATICEGTNHQLSASVTNFDELLWTTTGDGTFEDENSAITFYYPGLLDILTGSVQLTIIVLPEFPCTLISQDDVDLSFQPPPSADAGEDAIIHSDENYQLSGLAVNQSYVYWITSGDGIFTNPFIIDPIYTPGNVDIANGGVILTLTAIPVAPCLVQDEDNMELTIDTITSVNNVNTNSALLFYPIPANDELKIVVPECIQGDFDLRMMNCSGFIVYEAKEKFGNINSQPIISVNTKELKNGLYFLELNGRLKSFVQKIVIQH